MRRREFITRIGAAAAAWPLFLARGQETVPTIIGVLTGIQSADSYERNFSALRKALGENGDLKAAICSSNIVRATVKTTGFPNWPPISCGGTSR